MIEHKIGEGNVMWDKIEYQKNTKKNKMGAEI